MEKGHGKGNNIKNQRSEAKGKGKKNVIKVLNMITIVE
jgi:hypothetical protein